MAQYFAKLQPTMSQITGFLSIRLSYSLANESHKGLYPVDRFKVDYQFPNELNDLITYQTHQLALRLYHAFSAPLSPLTCILICATYPLLSLCLDVSRLVLQYFLNPVPRPGHLQPISDWSS